MTHLQHELVEEAIARRQRATHAAEISHLAPERRRRLEDEAHTAVAIAALRGLRGDGDFAFLVEVLAQLVDEVAGARSAVEDERALEGLR